MKKTLLSIFATAALMTSQIAVAQDITFPRPSQTATVKQGFATSFVELSYSRPNVNNRTIFGGLVPYGEVWRTGANQATTIEFGQKVTIGGKDIEKGKYGLLTIPGKEEWTVIITKDLTVTSAGAYKQENDVVRVTAKVANLSETVETFTIALKNVKDNSFTLDIKWEKSKVSVEVSANYEAELMAQIEKVMSTDTRPYYAAASYYYNNNKDMAKALEWINKADEASPDRYWVQMLKAKIQYANKQYNEAIETAEKAKANAEKAGNKNYAAQMETMIAEIKALPDYKAPKGKKK